MRILRCRPNRGFQPAIYLRPSVGPPLTIKQHRIQPRGQAKTISSSCARLSSMTSSVLSAVVSSPATSSGQPGDVGDRAHHNKDGKGFINPWKSYRDFTPFSIISQMLSMRLRGEWNNPDTTPPTVPVRKPEFLTTRQTDRLRATWLGHACFLAEFPGGFRALFDPVFTDRCSPFSFMGPKRYTKMPCEIEDIPIIDAVIISHSHYDHLSYPTVMKIAERHPKTHFFVPLGNKSWFENCGISANRVTEMDWWEEKTITLSRAKDPSVDETTKTPSSPDPEQNSSNVVATIGCLPCQHTSARTPFNKAHTLWASWSVTSGAPGQIAKKLWFGGDTGYRAVPRTAPGEFDYGEKYADLPHCPAFKEIGKLRGPFDLGLIPIGAYDPRFIMSPMHANPYDSVNIFSDTRCARALGIHWGTWVLTTEEVLQPPKMLREALKWKGLSEEGVFDVCDIGESREFA